LICCQERIFKRRGYLHISIMEERSKAAEHPSIARWGDVTGEWQTPAEVMAYAATMNTPMTVRRLHRFQTAGLIPRPLQRGAGKKRGSTVLYPPDTGKQLVAADRFMKIERDIRAVRWRLWRNRFAVEIELVRQHIVDALIESRPGAERFVADGEVDRRRIEHFVSKRLRKSNSGVVNRIAERLGPSRVVDLFTVYSEMFAGTFSTWRLSDAIDPLGTFGALAKLFGLNSQVTRPDLDDAATLRAFRATNLDAAIAAVREGTAFELGYAKEKGLTIAYAFTQMMNQLAPTDRPRSLDSITAEDQMALFGLFFSSTRALSRAQGRDVLVDIPQLPF
jgi:hypothetical protein